MLIKIDVRRTGEEEDWKKKTRDRGGCYSNLPCLLLSDGVILIESSLAIESKRRESCVTPT